MNTYLAASLAEDRRRTLVAEAVTYRRVRTARRLVRRARPHVDAADGMNASLPPARRLRTRPLAAFSSWHATGQL